MRGMLLVILSFGVTVLAWGVYGPVLHWGQAGMAEEGIKYARLRPFVCVGLAYFLIGVIVPAIVLRLKGEQGSWTMSGIVQSLLAGALGAVGALGIIMAFTFGGKPAFVMPLVFGGAPVVNAFLTIYLAKKMNQVGSVFLAGLLMVLIGAVTVLTFAPKTSEKKDAAPQVAAEESTDQGIVQEVKEAGKSAGNFGLMIASIATVILCWGAYGPTLHKGQAAMQNSRLRPLICVGLAYFAIAVVVPTLLLNGPMPEPSTYLDFSGTFWSLMAGSAGAVGALGIILAFNFGGKPVYVMPLVFGGAPAVNTLFSATMTGAFSKVGPMQMGMFMAGLMLTIAGAALVLVFAPKGGPPKKPAEPATEPASQPSQPAPPENEPTPDNTETSDTTSN